MNKQNRITNKHKLLDENGHVSEPGYPANQLLEYNHNDIKAGQWRIKEWDYYYTGNSKHAIDTNIADNSYMALLRKGV